jgi:putative phage-type endonuclease
MAMASNASNTDTGTMMVIAEDVLAILKGYETTVYTTLFHKEPVDDLIKVMTDALIAHYQIPEESSEGDTSLYRSKREYLWQIALQEHQRFVSESTIRLRNRVNVLDTLEQLKTLELPGQRSPEWYAMREKVLTASSLADALGKGHFNTRDGLLIDKTNTVKAPFISNSIMEWGVMYEQVATTFYEKLNGLTIVEFGLVPHPNFPIFGASPDGICDHDSPKTHVGRMLEIKCPPKRQFTKEVPEHYWMQMQGQLETCDLEECDFLQVKLDEYPDTKAYQEDVFMESDGSVRHGYTEHALPKGLVLAFQSIGEDGHPRFTYEYSPYAQTMSGILKWKELIMDAHPGSSYDTCIEHWYKIVRYECTLVLRDRSWWSSVMPKIIDFWEDVEHYREIGNGSLIEKRDARKNKRKGAKKIKLDKGGYSAPKKATTVIQVNKDIVDQIQSTYLLDSDEE